MNLQVIISPHVLLTSEFQDLKHNIIDDALTVIVSHVIIPCSGWDGGDVERDPNVDVWWSTVFKNASGVLRSVKCVLCFLDISNLSRG